MRNRPVPVHCRVLTTEQAGAHDARFEIGRSGEQAIIRQRKEQTKLFCMKILKRIRGVRVLSWMVCDHCGGPHLDFSYAAAKYVGVVVPHVRTILGKDSDT